MNALRMKRPSAAFVVAMVALFVALGGTAGAVATQAVPLAKRALVADNAKKLGGKTPAQIVAQASAQGAKAALSQSPAGPRPASTTAGLVVSKSLAAGAVPSGSIRTSQIPCDAGQTVVGGGMSSDGLVAMFDSYPLNATTWEVAFANLGSETANVSIYALCLK